MNNNTPVTIVDGKHMIGEYQAFPIYSITINWFDSGIGKKDSTHVYKMFKEEQPPEVLQKLVDDYIVERSKKHTISDVTSSFKLYLYETWELTWFSHRTYDLGQTDEQARDSFEQYVQRHEWYQRDPNYYKVEGRICLMGAEDRYRWKSRSDDGEENYEQVPCRCSKCKEAAMLVIDH